MYESTRRRWLPEHWSPHAGPLLVFSTTFCLYLLTRSARYYFDSIDYALIAETGRSFFWSKHLFQHLLHHWFFQLWQMAGYKGNVLLPLAVFGGFFGAAGATAFYLLIERISHRRTVALLSALGLALSAGYWVNTTVIEILIAPLACLILSIYFVTRAAHDPRLRFIVAAALTHGLSIGLYKMYFIFYPVLAFGVVVLLPRRRWLLGVLYSAILAAMIFVLHALWLALSPKPVTAKSFTRLLFDESHYLDSLLSGDLLAQIHDAIEATVSSVVRVPYAWQAQSATGRVFFVLGVMSLTALLIWWIHRRRPRWRRVIAFSAGFLAVFWIPFAPVVAVNRYQYGFPLLVPLWLLFACTFSILGEDRRRAIRAIAPTVVLCMVAANYLLTIRPNADASKNEDLQRSLFLRRETRPKDLIIFVGAGYSSSDSMYVPFFARREPFSFYRFYTSHDHFSVRYLSRNLFTALSLRIDRQFARGADTFVYGDVLKTAKGYPTMYSFCWPVQADAILEFLKSSYRFEPYQRFPDGERLLRLRRR